MYGVCRQWMKMQGGRRGESEREEDKIKRGKRPRAAAQKPSGAEQQKKKSALLVLLLLLHGNQIHRGY